MGLDIAEIFMDIEDAFGIRIELNDDEPGDGTVGSLINAVHSLLPRSRQRQVTGLDALIEKYGDGPWTKESALAACHIANGVHIGLFGRFRCEHPGPVALRAAIASAPIPDRDEIARVVLIIIRDRLALKQPPKEHQHLVHDLGAD